MIGETIGGYWPLYEDGTPVRIGDTVQGTFEPMTVKSVEVYAATTTVIGDCDHLHLSPGERVERVGDAPAGVLCLCNDDGVVETRHIAKDRQTWHVVIDGVRYGVGFNARGVIADALDLCSSSRRLPPCITWPEVDGEPVVPGDVLWDCDGHRHEVSEVKFTAEFPAGAVEMDSGGVWWIMNALTRTEPEPEPVLDRDGVPIEVGDTVYRDDGSAHTVNRLLRGKRFNVRTFSETGNVYEIRDEDLTHERPDSFEQVATDAQKEFQDYWSCQGMMCNDCPSKVDGKIPRQQYGVGNCGLAMKADIAARVRALAGVGDE